MLLLVDEVKSKRAPFFLDLNMRRINVAVCLALPQLRFEVASARPFMRRTLTNPGEGDTARGGVTAVEAVFERVRVINGQVTTVVVGVARNEITDAIFVEVFTVSDSRTRALCGHRSGRGCCGSRGLLRGLLDGSADDRGNSFSDGLSLATIGSNVGECSGNRRGNLAHGTLVLGEL